MREYYRLTVETASASAVAAAFPLFASGEQSAALIDEAAATALVEVLEREGLGSIDLVSAEGARDGMPTVELPHRSSASLRLYCDPIDGSLNAARGGPRSFSVIALSASGPSTRDRVFNDAQAIFALGSQTADVSDAFGVEGAWEALVAGSLENGETLTATLSRKDNLELFDQLSPPDLGAWRAGSDTGYRPTLARPGQLAVGDATVTLPLECDLMVGRIGLVEAQIESSLYASWAGLAVSRDRLLSWPGGSRSYVNAHLEARMSGDPDAAARLFTAGERERFESCGVSLLSVLEPLTAHNFGPGLDSAIAIAALSSPHDPALELSGDVLKSPVRRGVWLDIDVISVVAGRTQRRTVPVSWNHDTTVSALERRES